MLDPSIFEIIEIGFVNHTGDDIYYNNFSCYIKLDYFCENKLRHDL